MNLNIEDGSAYYPYVIRENDDTDDEGDSYEITGDDGQDGDAESVEHYIERTKRNVPIQESNNKQTHKSDSPDEIFTHPIERTSTSMWPKFVIRRGRRSKDLQEETKDPNIYHYITTEIPTTTYEFPICACTRRGRRSVIWNSNSQKSKLEDVPSYGTYYKNYPTQAITKDPLAKFDEYWNLFPTTTTTEGVPTTINYVTLWPKFLIRRGRRSVPLDKFEKYWKEYPTTTTTTEYSKSDTTDNLNTKFCNCNRRSKRSTHFAQNKDNWESVEDVIGTKNGANIVSDENDDLFSTTQGIDHSITTTTYLPPVNDALYSTSLGRNHQEPSNEPLSEASQPNNPVINVKHVKNKRAANAGLSPFSLFLINQRVRNAGKAEATHALWDTIKSIFTSSETNPTTNLPDPPVTTPAATTPEAVHTTIAPKVFKEFIENLPSKSMDVIRHIQHEMDPVNVDHLYDRVKTYENSYGSEGFLKIRRHLLSTDTTVTLPPRSPPGVPEFMLIRPNQTLDLTEQSMIMNNQSIKKGLGMRNKRSVDENKEETRKLLAGENVNNKRNKRCFWRTITTTYPPQSTPSQVPYLTPFRPAETLDVMDKYNQEHDPLDADQIQTRMENVRKSRDIPTSVNTEIPLRETTTSSKNIKIAESQQQIKDKLIYNFLLHTFHHMIHTQTVQSMIMDNQSIKKGLEMRNKRSVDENKEETRKLLAGENVNNKRNKRCFWRTVTTTYPPQSTPSQVPYLTPFRPAETLDVMDKYNQEHDPLDLDQIQTRMENVRKSRDILTKRIKRNIPSSVNTEIPLPQTTTQSKEEKLATLKIQLKDSILFNYLMYKVYHLLASEKRPSIAIVNENTEKEFRTRNKRSVDDYDIETTTVDELEDEEKVLEKTRIAEQKATESFTKWWNEFQPRAVVEYENRKHWREQLNNEDYDNYPERKPSPSPIEYLKSCKAKGIPYKDALIQWRQIERLHRMWRAEVEYTAYPNKNRPEIVMEDFDLTYKDIIYDFDPQHPEGTADDPTAYLVQTQPNGSRIPARKSRHDVWLEKQARAFPSPVENVQEQLLENEVLRSVESQSTIKNRKRRSSDQRTTSKVAWRCMMPVDADLNEPQTLPENGVKYLTVGGRIIEDKMELNENQR